MTNSNLSKKMIKSLQTQQVAHYVIKNTIAINKPLILRTQTTALIAGKKKTVKHRYGIIIPTSEDAVSALKVQLPNLTTTDLLVNENSILKFAGRKIPHVFLFDSEVTTGTQDINNTTFIETNLDATKYQNCQIEDVAFYNCSFADEQNQTLVITHSTFENVFFAKTIKANRTIFKPDTLNNKLPDTKTNDKFLNKFTWLFNSKTKFLALTNDELNYCYLNFKGRHDLAIGKQISEISDSKLDYVTFDNFANFKQVILPGTETRAFIVAHEKPIDKSYCIVKIEAAGAKNSLIKVMQINSLTNKLIRTTCCNKGAKVIYLV